jgi:HEAT repeat protein
VPIAFTLLLGLLLQATPQQLIEQLQAERVQDRNAAQKQLAALGRAAVPELERAARSPDLELARRASTLLRQIALQEHLSPAVVTAVPNAAELLASGTDQTYAQVFLRLCATPKVLPADLEPLALSALRGSEAKDKRQIMTLIMALNLSSALPELTRMAGDPGEPLADYAIQMLIKMDTPAARSLLLDLLRHPVGELRFRGLMGLQRLAAPDVAPRIAPLLADPDPVVRINAVVTLEKLKAYDLLPRIVDCLWDKDSGVSSCAAHALVTWQAVQAAPLILPQLQNAEPRVRLRAIYVLGRLLVREASSAMIERLNDKSGDVRAAAAVALTDFNVRVDLARLLPLLTDKDPSVQTAGLWAATSFGHVLPDPLLTSFLVHDESDLRVLGAWAAGRNPESQVGPSLVKLLADSDAAPHAAVAAGRHGVQDALPALLKLAAGTTSAAVPATEAAALLAEPSTLPSLLDLLVSDNKDAPELIAPAFRRLRPPGLVEQVAAKMDTGAFRERSIRFLGALKDPRAAGPLLKLLKDEDEEVALRGAAALALARVGHRDAVPAILALAASNKTEAGTAAVRALALLGARDTLKDLKALLPGARSDYELELIRAFESFGATEMLDALAPRLDDLSRHADHFAATWLCSAGRREGVRWIMDDDEGMIAVNAVRNPEAWKKLTSVVLTGDAEGTCFEIAQGIAEKAGLTLDWGRQDFIPEIPEVLRRFRIPPRGDSARGDVVLEDLMKLMDDHYDVVLEGNTLRVLPCHRSRYIFREWWASSPLNKDR